MPWVVATNSYNSGKSRQSVREGQALVCRGGTALSGPDIDVLDAPFRETDQLNLNGQGCAYAAELWSKCLWELFYAEKYPVRP